MPTLNSSGDHDWIDALLQSGNLTSSSKRRTNLKNLHLIRRTKDSCQNSQPLWQCVLNECTCSKSPLDYAALC